MAVTSEIVKKRKSKTFQRKTNYVHTKENLNDQSVSMHIKTVWSVTSQVAKANGGHKKNVWEIMRCPEYVLKCNKSVHLPARVSFLCLLGDLWVT